MAVFAVRTAKGPKWDHARGIREQEAWGEHAAFADGLVDRRVVVLGGPISSDNEDDVGLLVVNATDEQEVQAIFSQDPWATNLVLRIKEVRAWTLWLDGRRSRSGKA
jgi:hypothetical protein